MSGSGGILSVDMLLHGTKTTMAKGESTEQFLKRLTHLTLTGKKLTTIDLVAKCPNVRVLYLYDNKITNAQPLASLRLVTHVHLQRNRLTKMEHLDSLAHLEKLYLDNNEIGSLQGLDDCTALLELHLANQTKLNHPFTFDHESVAAIAPTLRVLNLSNCNIHDARPLQALRRLEQLDLSRNHISEIEDVFGLVGSLYCLRELDLTNNHVNATPKYREHTIVFSQKTLEILDKKPIDSKQRSMMQSHIAFKHKKRQAAAASSQRSKPESECTLGVTGNNNWALDE
ncbi:hypothetical protein AC1031_009522 [Aphanomyces cochlioides]|nr:hypothetical protein AC1031_009522 [Aphanomyces cochlioides]